VESRVRKKNSTKVRSISLVNSPSNIHSIKVGKLNHHNSIFLNENASECSGPFSSRFKIFESNSLAPTSNNSMRKEFRGRENILEKFFPHKNKGFKLRLPNKN